MNYYNYPNNAFSPPGVSNLPYTAQMGGAIQQPSYSPAQNQNNNGLIWVQGEAGAKSYLVAPNTTIMLMDSEASKFYLKSADASGMPLPPGSDAPAKTKAISFPKTAPSGKKDIKFCKFTRTFMPIETNKKAANKYKIFRLIFSLQYHQIL